jgi:putative transposase
MEIHRFNDSYRDIQEELAYRGIIVSHETIRSWCIKFSAHYKDVIRKRERKPKDKWHLDEMTIRINGEYFILWRAVDSDGHELDVYLQKRRNKKSAIRFLIRILGCYPAPRIIVTDKLKSYIKPIRQMCPATEHRSHKGLNNRAENAHQPTRRKEKSLIKFKSPQGVQTLLQTPFYF